MKKELLRLIRAKRHLIPQNGRSISTEGVTTQEMEFEALFADDVEPLIVALYEAILPSLTDDLPEEPESIVTILLALLAGTAAAAALLAFLQEILLGAYNLGGSLALIELGLDDEFSLIDQGVIDQINAYAEELLETLLITTANDLARRVENGRNNGLSMAAILVGLTSFIALRSAFRANVIAMNEMVFMTRWGMGDAYRRNGVLEVEFNTQRDGNVDNGDPLGPCVVQDGNVYEINNIPPEARIPLHVGCRCFWLPLTDDWTVPDVVWRG